MASIQSVPAIAVQANRVRRKRSQHSRRCDGTGREARAFKKSWAQRKTHRRAAGRRAPLTARHKVSIRACARLVAATCPLNALARDQMHAHVWELAPAAVRVNPRSGVALGGRGGPKAPGESSRAAGSTTWEGNISQLIHPRLVFSAHAARAGAGR